MEQPKLDYKKNESYEVIKVNLKTLFGLSLIRSNRIGHLNYKEALQADPSIREEEYDAFKRRANKTANNIRKNGFRNDSFFVIAQGTDGLYYLLDGQGRRMALYLIVNNSKLTTLAQELSNIEYPAILYKGQYNEEGLHQLVIGLNTGKVNFSSYELIRSDALKSGGEKLENYQKFHEWEKLVGMGNNKHTIANKIFYGDKVTKAQIDGSKVSFAPDHQYVADAYRKYVINADYKGDNTNEVWDERMRNSVVRSTDFGVYFQSRIRYFENRLKGKQDELDEYVNYFISICIDTVRTLLSRNSSKQAITMSKLTLEGKNIAVINSTLFKTLECRKDIKFAKRVKLIELMGETIKLENKRVA